MTTYFKAVRPDGTDFYTGTVDYASLCGTGRTLPLLPGGPCCGSGVYHASTEAAETLLRGSWPCRLFRVKGISVSSDGSKRGFRTLEVLEELPAHLALGPNGLDVAALVDRTAHLTSEQATRIAAARSAVRSAAWDAARSAAWDAVRSAWGAARSTAQFAAGALVVRDLLTPEQFGVLYGPWESVMGPETAR